MESAEKYMMNTRANHRTKIMTDVTQLSGFSLSTREKSQTQEDEVVERTPSIQLKTAYLQEKRKLEVIEIELNRSKIVVMDQNGNRIRIPLIKEH